MSTYDLVIIGSGPAGYVAAIRAAQLGLKTACIEKDKTLGGTCLNVGCIPSKALLESSEHFWQVKNKFQKHGIQVGDVKLDLPQMIKRKDEVVRNLTQGIAGLFKKNKIDWLVGHGSLLAAEGGLHRVQVQGATDKTVVTTKNVLIATGSSPVELPFLTFNGTTVVSSTEALSLPSVPKHLVVIGGGVIGLELGSVWMRLGAKVTVIEFQDRFLASMDADVAKELQRSLTKQGMEFKFSTKCLGAKVTATGATVELEDLTQPGTKSALECDVVLVAVGRRPYTDQLGLDLVGIPMDKAGRVEIDSHYRTNVTGIYAVGDVVKGPMLAHKAEEEGIAAAELIAGKAGHVNYEAIPNVIYTHPEIATVGATEAQLKERGVAYKTGSFPYMANGRARSMEESEGLVKIIADAKTDRVLGVHICGAQASNLIAEAVSVMEFGGSAEDIARTCHAHPTLSEVVKEAALAVDGRRIHL